MLPHRERTILSEAAPFWFAASALFRSLASAKLLLLFIFVAASCSRGEFTDLDYLTVQRQKVAAALAGGVNTHALQPLVDDIKAGHNVLDVDFSIDRAGCVRFLGQIDYAGLRERLSVLAGNMEVEQYREKLALADECIDVKMYYDGNVVSHAATVTLGLRRLRDSYGEFLAYMPFFRFRSGVTVSVQDFFNDREFDDYRESLRKMLNISSDD